MDPVGPLPASVYWRRRMLAVGATLLGLFGLLWLATALILPPADDSSTDRAAQIEQQNPADQNRQTGGTPAAGTPASGPVNPAPPTSPASVTPAAPGTPGLAGAPPAGAATGSSTGPASPNAGPVDETVRPDDTPRPAVVVPPSGPSPPTGPPPCTDRMIKVGAEVGQPEYKVGARPVLRLVVTNVSGQACVRDLDGTLQEIVVWSGDGKNRLWSSNDCSNPASDDLRTLVPGQPVAFAVTWSGLGSVPGCGVARDRLPAGAYRVLTRLGPVISDPAPFLLS
ncbi:hypothetical protein EV383_5770 [Pseudonocardia sediminis]|uniref:MucR family transcriptional regulator n=2 Tax=Pseudonocardia sediminis TaxID=1397368 RepID=A0A4V2FRI8_PSEST|nr:hypothetical protein EV383_5770 [Pseudonocardia sediminis]